MKNYQVRGIICSIAVLLCLFIISGNTVSANSNEIKNVKNASADQKAETGLKVSATKDKLVQSIKKLEANQKATPTKKDSAAKYYYNSILLKTEFVNSSHDRGQIKIPFTLYCFGGGYESYYVQIYDANLKLVANHSAYFPNTVGSRELTLTWDASDRVSGEYYVRFYSTYDDSFIDTIFPFTIKRNENECFSKVLTGTQNARNNNLYSPLSAWRTTKATLQEYSWEEKIPYELRLEELYFGSEAAAIVKAENQFNAKPANGQQWILMKYQIKNNGKNPLYAYDIINGRNFYTNKGASLQVFDMATLSGEREGLGIYDVELYPGASGVCWYAMLVPESAGFPYLKISNGYTNNAQISWLDTNPNQKYKVTFQANGGKIQGSNAIWKKDGEAYGTLPTASRAGYTFAGWYTSATGGSKIDHKTVGRDYRTVYARWNPVKYNVSYVLNGGKHTGNPTTYTTDKAYTLKAPTRKGYLFAGWHMDSKCTKKVTSITKGSTGTKKLYAKWTKVIDKAPTLQSLSSGKKLLTAKWNKISGVAGYQIQYSLKSNMSSAKMVTASSGATSKQITKLTKGKKYYVRIRVYTKDSTGAMCYGKWSSVKNVKVK